MSDSRSPALARGSASYYAHLMQLLDGPVVLSQVDKLWVDVSFEAVLDFYAIAIARIERDCPSNWRNMFGAPDIHSWNTLHEDPESNRAFMTALKLTPLHEDRYNLEAQEALRIAESQTRRMFLAIRDWRPTIEAALRAEHQHRAGRPDTHTTFIRPLPEVQAILRNRATEIAARHGDDTDSAQTDLLWASMFFQVLYRNLRDKIDRSIAAQ